MKNKLIALTLISSLSLQTTAFAAQDRTLGIETQSAAEAKENLSHLKINLVHLHNTLENAKNQVKNRSKSGNISSGAALIGAGIGLGFTTLSYLTIKRKGIGNEMAGVAFTVISTFATTGSALMGLLSNQVLKEKVDTKKLNQELIQLNESVENQMNETTDRKIKMAMAQLRQTIVNTAKAVEIYENTQNSQTTSSLATNISQLIGSALISYGATMRNGSAIIASGAIVSTAGNIGQLMMFLSDDQADEILEEINRTQQTITIVTSGL